MVPLSKVETTTRQREFWKRYLDRYPGMEALTTRDRRRTHGKYAIRTVATLLERVRLHDLRHHTVLDFGCGTGRLAKFVAPLCKRLVCMDISSDMLDQARRTLAGHDNIEFRLTDGHDLGLSPGEIDFAYSYATLMYLDPESFWRTVALLDTTARELCLHLHVAVNESPNPLRSIAELADGRLYDVEGYRPTERTLRSRYPGEHYWVERHRPDVRGREPFFYKSTAPRGGRLTALKLVIRRARLRGVVRAAARL